MHICHARPKPPPLLLVLATMLLSPAWADAPLDEPASARAKRAHVTRHPGRLWPDHTVYYSLTNASPDARRAFLQAARHIAANSGVDFVEHTDQANYLYITSSDQELGCTTEQGMNGGAQELAISSFCQDEHSVLHETLHALGFHHEQQRPDRDDHIEVIPALQNEYNFKPIQDSRIIGPYDMESVMHYDQSYGRTSQAWRPLSGGIPARSDGRTRLSPGDIAALNQLYGARPAGRAPLRPGDNGLRARLSKRELALSPNASGQIEVTLPAGIEVRHARVWSEHPATAEVSPQARGDNHYRLRIGARAEGETRLFFRFTTRQGQTGTVVMRAHVVNPVSLASESRQLVSAYNRQCLRAQPNAAARQKGPDPDYPHDRSLAWTRVAPEQLELGLAPCDGDDPWQQWMLQRDGQLAIARLNSRGCLVPGEQGLLKMEPCSCKPKTPPVEHLWRQEHGKLVHSASGQALTHVSGNLPMLHPQGVSWQDWSWY